MHAVLKPPENKFIAEEMFIQVNIMQNAIRGIHEDCIRSVCVYI